MKKIIVLKKYSYVYCESPNLDTLGTWYLKAFGKSASSHGMSLPKIWGLFMKIIFAKQGRLTIKRINALKK